MAQDDVIPSDFDFFIEDLQRAIEEAPPGYQSKFARVVAELKQKKLGKIAELQAILHPGAGEEINYEYLLQTLRSELEDPTAARADRFGAALRMAQLRGERYANTGEKDPEDDTEG